MCAWRRRYGAPSVHLWLQLRVRVYTHVDAVRELRRQIAVPRAELIDCAASDDAGLSTCARAGERHAVGRIASAGRIAAAAAAADTSASAIGEGGLGGSTRAPRARAHADAVHARLQPAPARFARATPTDSDATDAREDGLTGHHDRIEVANEIALSRDDQRQSEEHSSHDRFS